MAKLKLTPPERRLPEPQAVVDEPLVQVRQRSRANLKDIIWVAVGLAIILIAMTIYQTGHDNERRAAQRQAQLRAATAAALPPPGYDSRGPNPTAGEVEADAAAREARALLAGNQAETAADPVLSPKVAAGAPALPAIPPSPRPFSDPGYPAAAPAPATTAPQTPK